MARGRAARLISLAAAPTFAAMALLTLVAGDGHAGQLCSTAHAPPLASMVPMYLLMSVFHAAPWLKPGGRRRTDGASRYRFGGPPGMSPDEVN
jgi:hypothetical protein